MICPSMNRLSCIGVPGGGPSTQEPTFTLDQLQEVLSVMKLQAAGWAGYVANPAGGQGPGVTAAISASQRV